LYGVTLVSSRGRGRGRGRGRVRTGVAVRVRVRARVMVRVRGSASSNQRSSVAIIYTAKRGRIIVSSNNTSTAAPIHDTNAWHCILPLIIRAQLVIFINRRSSPTLPVTQQRHVIIFLFLCLRK
jgi:hypothetical protein